MKYAIVTRFFFVVLCFISISLLVSCERDYPEGPSISFKSREARMINNWRVKYLSRNEYDETKYYDKYEMTFAKGGTTSTGGDFTWVIKSNKGDTTEYKITSKWLFAAEERQFNFTYPNTNKQLYCTIERLKDRELWIRYQIDNDYFYVKLIPN